MPTFCREDHGGGVEQVVHDLFVASGTRRHSQPARRHPQPRPTANGNPGFVMPLQPNSQREWGEGRKVGKWLLEMDFGDSKSMINNSMAIIIRGLLA